MIRALLWINWNICPNDFASLLCLIGFDDASLSWGVQTHLHTIGVKTSGGLFGHYVKNQSGGIVTLSYLGLSLSPSTTRCSKTFAQICQLRTGLCSSAAKEVQSSETIAIQLMNHSWPCLNGKSPGTKLRLVNPYNSSPELVSKRSCISGQGWHRRLKFLLSPPRMPSISARAQRAGSSNPTPDHDHPRGWALHWLLLEY